MAKKIKKLSGTSVSKRNVRQKAVTPESSGSEDERISKYLAMAKKRWDGKYEYSNLKDFVFARNCYFSNLDYKLLLKLLIFSNRDWSFSEMAKSLKYW